MTPSVVSSFKTKQSDSRGPETPPHKTTSYQYLSTQRNHENTDKKTTHIHAILFSSALKSSHFLTGKRRQRLWSCAVALQRHCEISTQMNMQFVCECGSMCTRFLCALFHLSRATLCWDINLAMWFITVFTHQPFWARLIMDAEHASECLRTCDAVITCACTLTKPPTLFKGISNCLLSLFCIIWLSVYPSIVSETLFF